MINKETTKITDKNLFLLRTPISLTETICMEYTVQRSVVLISNDYFNFFGIDSF